jgi:hypothetical protein
MGKKSKEIVRSVSVAREIIFPVVSGFTREYIYSRFVVFPPRPVP